MSDEPEILPSHRPVVWLAVPLPRTVPLPADASIGFGNDDLEVAVGAHERGVDSLLERLDAQVRVVQLPGAGTVDNRTFALAAVVDPNVDAGADAPFGPSDVTAVEVTLPLARADVGREPDPAALATLKNEDTLTVAFDAALEVVHRVQQAWNAIQGEHLPLVRRGHMPFGIPYTLGWIFDDGTERRVTPGILLVNGAGTPDMVGDPPDGIWEQFTHSVDQHSTDPPLAPWYLLRDRAIAIRDFDGDRSLAVIVANTAAEVLLDAVLAMLLWEEGIAPEAAASQFSHADAWARTKPRLEPRLGAGWDPKQHGSETAKIYGALGALRNRVVHAGYVPTADETDVALDALARLQSHVRTALESPATVGRYPLTAVAVCSTKYLVDSGRLTKKARSRLDQLAGLNIAAPFHRWEWHVTQLRRQDQLEPGTTPDVVDVVVVAAPDGSLDWWLFDRATRHAAPASAGNLEDKVSRGLSAAARAGNGHLMMTVHADPLPTATGDWVPDYQALPNHFIFADDAPAFPVD